MITSYAQVLQLFCNVWHIWPRTLEVVLLGHTLEEIFNNIPTPINSATKCEPP